MRDVEVSEEDIEMGRRHCCVWHPGNALSLAVAFANARRAGELRGEKETLNALLFCRNVFTDEFIRARIAELTKELE